MRRQRRQGVRARVGFTRHPRGQVAAGRVVSRVRDRERDSQRRSSPGARQSSRVRLRAHRGVPGAEQRPGVRDARV